MVNCTAEHHFSAILVRFEDGKTLLIQGDTDQEAFLNDCGVTDIDDVERCSSEYYDYAEHE
jgi:hypothetical protein